MSDALFYVLALLILIAAVATVQVRNLLHATIAFIGCLLGSACLFLLLGNELVALMQVMVYAGGVVIFVVYTILLTNRAGEAVQPPARPVMLIALCLSAMAALALIGYGALAAPTAVATDPAPAVEDLGRRLLSAEDTGFVVAFELVALLLLAALVAATAVARRNAHQPPSEDMSHPITAAKDES